MRDRQDFQRAEHMHAKPAAAASTQGLLDRAELALISVERTRMPMVIADARQPDVPIVLANKAFLQLTGFSPSEVVGKNCRFLQGPDTSPAAVEAIRRGIHAERDVEVEILNYNKAGEPFWNRLGISPIHDDKGDLIYFFASQIDVTRQHKIQELEEAERRLLREVDHRALNALALVNAMVRLTRAETCEQYAAAVSGRVGALTRAHVMLADSGWKEAALESLMTTELTRLGSGRAVANGPSIDIPPRVVQPLVLFLHELTSNALTHGSCLHPEGRVSLGWARSAGDEITLIWVEQGGPAPQKFSSAGYGLTVARAIIERELEGSLRIDLPDSGLIAEARFSAHA